ncbi:MAG: hypothetical protein IJD26_03305, partial [Lachnospiraceae bacterium]|nr:hypothetical protein [Lachnospiraceae bacterium]
VLVAVNRGESERPVELPVWELGLGGFAPMVTLCRTGRDGHSTEASFVHAENGTIRVVLPPESSFVWKNLLPWGNQRNKENLDRNFR